MYFLIGMCHTLKDIKCKMLSYKIMLFVILTLFTSLSLKCSTVLARVLNTDSGHGGNNDIKDTGLQPVEREKPSHWRMDKLSENSKPFVSFVSGKSKEWSNFERSHNSKRSDDRILGPVPNPSMPDSLGGMNMSNPISKYHCPINLLYGNNLTVKNYFLLVPSCNMSSNETLMQLQSMGEEGEGVSISPAQPGINLANDMEKFSLTCSSTETMTTSLNLTTMTSAVSSLESSQSTTEHNNKSVEVIFFEKDKDNTSSSGGVTLLGVEVTNVAEIFSMPVITMSLPDTAVSSPISMTQTNTTKQHSSTFNVTVNPKEEILRTVDKYCLTFNMSDNGTYTINPVSLPQVHFQGIIEDNISNAGQIGLEGRKKRKRTINKRKQTILKRKYKKKK